MEPVPELDNEAISRLKHAEKVKSMSVLKSSQSNYQGKLNTIKVYLKEVNRNDLIDGANNIVVPLDYNTVLAPLFSWLSTNVDLPKRKGWARKAPHLERETTTATDEQNQELLEDDADEEMLTTTELVATAGLNVYGEEPTGDLTSPDAALDEAAESVTISPSCMQGYKSALKWWYKRCGAVMDPTTEQALEEFIQGYKNIVSEKRSKGVMKITEGKSLLSVRDFV